MPASFPSLSASHLPPPQHVEAQTADVFTSSRRRCDGERRPIRNTSNYGLCAVVVFLCVCVFHAVRGWRCCTGGAIAGKARLWISESSLVFIFNSPVWSLRSSARLTIRSRTLSFVSASFPGLKLMRFLCYCRNILYSFNG